MFCHLVAERVAAAGSRPEDPRTSVDCYTRCRTASFEPQPGPPASSASRRAKLRRQMEMISARVTIIGAPASPTRGSCRRSGRGATCTNHSVRCLATPSEASRYLRLKPSRRHGIMSIPPNQIARKSISTFPKPAISNTCKTRAIVPPGRFLHFSRATDYIRILASIVTVFARFASPTPSALQDSNISLGGQTETYSCCSVGRGVTSPTEADIRSYDEMTSKCDRQSKIDFFPTSAYRSSSTPRLSAFIETRRIQLAPRIGYGAVLILRGRLRI